MSACKDCEHMFWALCDDDYERDFCNVAPSDT